MKGTGDGEFVFEIVRKCRCGWCVCEYLRTLVRSRPQRESSYLIFSSLLLLSLHFSFFFLTFSLFCFLLFHPCSNDSVVGASVDTMLNNQNDNSADQVTATGEVCEKQDTLDQVKVWIFDFSDMFLNFICCCSL